MSNIEEPKTRKGRGRPAKKKEEVGIVTEEEPKPEISEEIDPQDETVGATVPEITGTTTYEPIKNRNKNLVFQKNIMLNGIIYNSGDELFPSNPDFKTLKIHCK